jgi:5'-phosphate synthase pdxT subunit
MIMTEMIGVLALQGDFQAHKEQIEKLGRQTMEVRTITDLQSCSALIIPGGESTTLLKLLSPALKEEIKNFAKQNKAILATCAGLILIANKVESPSQESLNLLNITVKRNAYGRQLDSFITQELHWTNGSGQLEGVFIRAPQITEVGGNIQVLIKHSEDPVLVQQNKILGATFHPELSDSSREIYRLFLSLI